ncbi:MAG: branched-chain amino acid ABC transporter permease [Spirochaetaceae bacterium]|nr:MAG: branched-chain amino acid ABC transporter permease [Spirochaetaceae bacterium]
MIFYAKVLETTLLFTMFVLSVYMLSGLTGLFSLGHGAFITLGAYTAGLATTRFGLPIWLAMVLAVVVGMIGGLIIGAPTLKLRRDYFLLVTFGFGEMVRALLLWTAQLTGGAMGLAGIPYAAELPLIGVSTLVVVVFVANLKKTAFGRTCIAIRDDELAAQAMGVNVYAHKIKVFLLSAAIASYGGALLAFNMSFIEPNLFNWLESAKLIVIIFVGGINSVTGALITGIFYYSFGELFRFAHVWRDVLLGVLVILVIVFRTQGLFGNWEFSPAWIKSVLGRKRSGKQGA